VLAFMFKILDYLYRRK